MTIISKAEFQAELTRNQTTLPIGKPVIGEPIPEKYKMPGPQEHSPLENHHAFTLPAEANAKHSAFNVREFGAAPFRDVRGGGDPSLSDWARARLQALPDYSGVYDNATVKPYAGYVIRKDPTYACWSIDGIAGMFTRIKFAYDKIDELNRLKEDPALQHKMIEAAKAAADERHDEQKEAANNN